MTETNLKKHASLRGVSEANDEANQLTEFKRGQSASVTTLTDFATLNRGKKLNVQSCHSSVRIWNRLSRLGCRAHIRSLAMTQCAFTMAEILLSLTIIGVVAAITLPSLMANINERTWNTQRKALYARLSQAIAMMPQLNGYGTLTEDADGNVTEDTAAETFLTEGLSKVLKINNICDNTHFADCGIPATITPLDGGSANGGPLNLSDINTLVGLNSMFDSFSIDGESVVHTYSQVNTKAAAFEAQNGESIIAYYNPLCVGDLNETNSYYTQPKMCVNFIYDLNGNKGPNTVGKDIGFITALYSSDSNVVAPNPLATNASGSSTQTAASEACTSQDVESRLPTRDELFAMFYNKKLLGMPDGAHWSSSIVSSFGLARVWNLYFTTGHINPTLRSTTTRVRCVKR